MIEPARLAAQVGNDNRDAKAAAELLQAAQRRQAAELAALGRAMHEHYRSELTNLAADYRHERSRQRATHRAEGATLEQEIRQRMKTELQGLAALQCEQRQTVAWRERSLLGR